MTHHAPESEPEPSTSIVGRHHESGLPIRVTIRDAVIVGVEPAQVEDHPRASWLAPAFLDIQTNGRLGVSFSDATLTADQVGSIVRAQAASGTARVCPTLITAGFEATRHGVAAIAEACRSSPEVGRMVAGIHLEGPWISSLDGYRGAHPVEHARDPDPEEFDAWQEAAEGRIRLVTLAPERDGAIAMIRRLVASGVAVALGHTAADGPTIDAAAAAGATLSTHLGNGIANPLARHPNPIWHQAGHDRLRASFIADGHHLDPSTLRVLVRAKGSGATILVSDASPLAGLPPGIYGDWAVDPAGKIVVAGTPYLAGSNRDLMAGLNTLLDAVPELGLAEAVRTVTSNPARILGLPAPRIEVGQPASIVRIERVGPRAIRLVETWVDGRRSEPVTSPRGEAAP
jgi:N-acetylglucosamine-6-phosphate deacetylase